MALSVGMPERCRAGETQAVTCSLLRAAEFREGARLELLETGLPPNAITAEPITIAAGAEHGVLTLRFAPDLPPATEYRLRFRATSLQQGRWPVRSEAEAVIAVEGAPSEDRAK
jgi:hypothetical protein